MKNKSWFLANWDEEHGLREEPVSYEDALRLAEKDGKTEKHLDEAYNSQDAIEFSDGTLLTPPDNRGFELIEGA